MPSTTGICASLKVRPQRATISLHQTSAAAVSEESVGITNSMVIVHPAPYRDATRRGGTTVAASAASAGSLKRETVAFRLSTSSASALMDEAVCLVLAAVFLVTDDISVIDLATCSEPRACCCAASEIA